MLRIVGLQRSDSADREFLLLQNQGSMRVHLRGHAIMSDSAFFSSDLTAGSYAFPDDVSISPGLYVILTTGTGTPRWAKTKDGAHVYHAYMFQNAPVWSRAELPLHMMGSQHEYSERTEPLLVR